MKQYVVGFLMDFHKQYIVLIRKTHPEWQAGKLNGVGGHVGEDETPEEAIVREFQEEAGLLISNWAEFARVQYPEAQIIFFRAFTTTNHLVKVDSKTDEEVVIRRLDQFDRWKDGTIHNLKYLIPLAQYTDESIQSLMVEVDFEGVTP